MRLSGRRRGARGAARAIAVFALAASAPVAAQSPCARPDRATVAVMVPATQTREEFQAELSASARPGVRAALLPYGQLPAIANRDSIQAEVFALLNGVLARQWINEHHSILVYLDSAGSVLRVESGFDDRELDEGMRGIWMDARFADVTVDGCRLPALLRVPAVFLSDTLRGRLNERHARQLRSPGREHDVTLAEALDAGAARAGLRDLAGGRRWLCRIRYAPNGVPDSVFTHALAPLDTLLENPALTALLTPLLRRIPPRHAPNTAWLMVRPGEDPQLRIANTSRPRLANSELVTRLLMETSRGAPTQPPPGAGYTVEVVARVEADGSTSEVELAGEGGIPFLDAGALDVARRMRFIPARVEGEGIPIRIRLPVTFQQARR